MKEAKGWLVDSHCHLINELYDNQQEEITKIIKESKKKGLKWIVNLGYNAKSNEEVVITGELDKELILTSVGIHPDEESDFTTDNLLRIEELIKEGKVNAIGEIGLDYSKNKSNEQQEKQKEFLKKQIKIAKKFDLPILVHVRDAFEDTQLIIKESGIRRGIIHCFTGDYQTALSFIKLGFLISMSGIVTFKNNRLQEIVSKLPLENLIVETDSPYLAPEPLRGKRNYPWNVTHTLEKISLLRNEERSEIEEQMIRNMKKLFRI